MEPISFLDGLVKGIVLIAYDFVKMTCYGIAIPFVRKKRRFWSALLSEQKYLSPLTYLVFWVLLTAAIGIRSGVAIASRVAGFEKDKTSIPVIGTIVFALAISIFADLVCRSPLFLFGSAGPRRRLYEGLIRIAVANLFVAACVVMVFTPLFIPSRSFWDDIFGPSRFLGSSVFGVAIPHPLLILLSAPLAIILVKAIAVQNRGAKWIQNRGAKWIIGSLFALAVPMLLLSGVYPIGKLVYLTIDVLGESSRIRLYPADVSCKLVSNQIHVTGYLRVEGAKAAVLKPDNFIVVYRNQGKNYQISLKAPANQSDIILSETTFTRISLDFEYDRENAAALKLDGGDLSSPSACVLVLRREPWTSEEPLDRESHYKISKPSNPNISNPAREPN